MREIYHACASTVHKTMRHTEFVKECYSLSALKECLWCGTWRCNATFILFPFSNSISAESFCFARDSSLYLKTGFSGLWLRHQHHAALSLQAPFDCRHSSYRTVLVYVRHIQVFRLHVFRTCFLACFYGDRQCITTSNLINRARSSSDLDMRGVFPRSGLEWVFLWYPWPCEVVAKESFWRNWGVLISSCNDKAEKTQWLE